SGVPSLERNLASVAVQRQGELFLFDCGEGAQIQYRRAGLGFAPLTAIAISHLHGDHVTGLMGLLMSLQMADRTEPLDVYGPPGLGEYIRCNRRALHTQFGYPLRLREEGGPALFREAEAYRLTAAPLDHRLFCLGFRLEECARPGRFDLQVARQLGVPEGPLFGMLQRGEQVTLPDGKVVEPGQVLGPPRPGVVIAYCTDTRPCAAAVELARDADLLIHEGTFDATMPDDAHRKGHSTVADAARVAVAAGVKQLVITHLSPRYGDVAPLLAQARAIFPNTRIARDLARVEVHHREA
ncbi:MAG TPA: ribonuclease Z, partial [Armatimonadota bacterium]|nr:ribonuclease Z [Armatimonadota bacterium]